MIDPFTAAPIQRNNVNGLTRIEDEGLHNAEVYVTIVTGTCKYQLETRTQDDPEHCKLTLIRYDCDASKRNAVYYFNSWPAEERTTNYLIMQNTS